MQSQSRNQFVVNISSSSILFPLLDHHIVEIPIEVDGGEQYLVVNSGVPFSVVLPEVATLLPNLRCHQYLLFRFKGLFLEWYMFACRAVIPLSTGTNSSLVTFDGIVLVPGELDKVLMKVPIFGSNFLKTCGAV